MLNRPERADNESITDGGGPAHTVRPRSPTPRIGDAKQGGRYAKDLPQGAGCRGRDRHAGRRDRHGGRLRLVVRSRADTRTDRPGQGARIRARQPALTRAHAGAGRPRGEQARRWDRRGPVLRVSRQRSAGARFRGRPGRRAPRRGLQDRARQEHLSRVARPARRRPELQLRPPLPLPGPRGRLAGRADARQPRRRRRRTASRCSRRRPSTARPCRRSTARPGTRGPSASC